MENKVELYESMMANVGKNRSQVWTEMATRILNESYVKDREVYGTETKEPYGILFESEELFESMDEKEIVLNEVNSGWTADPRGAGAGAASAALPGFAGFVSKIKSFFASMGGSISKYFSGGIAGIVANPWPLVGAGVGVGIIAALIAKFRKMSKDKQAKALAKLSSEKKAKAEAILAKDPAELKKELEAKAKPGEKKEEKKESPAEKVDKALAASADTDKKKKC